MAKSMRSKIKRKMRAIKRTKIDAKLTEKMKIKSTLIKEQEIASLVKITNPRQKDSTPGEIPKEMVTDVDMGDALKTTKFYNKKTLKDEHGQYPVWVNKRTVIRNKIKSKKSKKAKRLKN